MNNTESLNCIKKISKHVIEKYAPDEVRYFNIIWKRFLKDDSSDVALGKTSILTFAEHSNIGLFSPSVLLVLKGVMTELNRKIDRPTYDQIKNAVHSCAVALGASRDIAAAVESDISEMVFKDITHLLDSVDGTDEPAATNYTVVIDSVNDVRVNGRKVSFDSRQPRVLLCELIRNNTLHWSIAYLLFPEWHDYEIDEIRKKFVKLTHKINMKKYGLMLRVELIKGHLGKPDYVRLEIPENVIVSGNVAEALAYVQDAEHLLEEGEGKEALDKALAACRKDAECLDAILLFSRAAGYTDSNIPGAWVYIERRLQCSLDLRIKVKRIIQKSHKSSELNVSLNPVFERCEEEIGKIDNAIEFLTKATGELKHNLTSEDYEFYNISIMLKKLKTNPEDFNVLHELYRNNNNTILEVLEKTHEALEKVNIDMSMSELTQKLGSYISNEGAGVAYDNLNHLKGHWIESLKRMIVKECKVHKGRMNFKSFNEDIHGKEL